VLWRSRVDFGDDDKRNKQQSVFEGASISQGAVDEKTETSPNDGRIK